MIYVCSNVKIINILFFFIGGFKGESKVKYVKKWREEEVIRE